MLAIQLILKVGNGFYTLRLHSRLHLERMKWLKDGIEDSEG
jgi:hypothetical protein